MENDLPGDSSDDFTLSAGGRLRVIAKIAVSVSLLSAFILLIALYFLLIDPSQKNYLEAVASLTRSQQQLAVAMFVSGALILLLAGFITWLITLYFSHRIAGPIFRFSKNLELEIEKGPVAIIAIRKEDCLQALSTKLGAAVESLSRYYDGQKAIIDQASRYLESNQSVDSKEFNAYLEKLRKTALDES